MIQAIGLVGLAVIAAVALCPSIQCRKVGGIWFARVGRVQVMFCICRARTVANDNAVEA